MHVERAYVLRGNWASFKTNTFEEGRVISKVKNIWTTNVQVCALGDSQCKTRELPQEIVERPYGNKDLRGFISRKRKGVDRLFGSIWKFRMQRFSWRTCTVRTAGVNVECRKHELQGGSEDMLPQESFKLGSLNVISCVPWTESG